MSACWTKYRHPHEAPCRTDWVKRLKIIAKVCPQEGERKEHHSAKNPHAPTGQKHFGGNPLVSSNFCEKADHNTAHYLTPVPPRAVFLAVLFGKISEDHVIVGAGPEMFQHPRCNSGGLFRRHAFSPFSSGKPFHKFIRARRASRTSRIPAPVMRKYRFARPPRSGVESPKLEVTRPRS